MFILSFVLTYQHLSITTLLVKTQVLDKFISIYYINYS